MGVLMSHPLFHLFVGISWIAAIPVYPLSFNVVAPLLLVLLTAALARGVKVESEPPLTNDWQFTDIHRNLSLTGTKILLLPFAALATLRPPQPDS